MTTGETDGDDGTTGGTVGGGGGGGGDEGGATNSTSSTLCNGDGIDYVSVLFRTCDPARFLGCEWAAGAGDGAAAEDSTCADKCKSDKSGVAAKTRLGYARYDANGDGSWNSTEYKDYLIDLSLATDQDPDAPQMQPVAYAKELRLALYGKPNNVNT